MKKILLCLATITFWASNALGADMAVKAPPSALSSASVNWTGCYAGVEGGGAFGHVSELAAPSGPAAPVGRIIIDHHDSGALAGGTLGCNHQIGPWVLGLEGDLSWTDYGGTHNALPPSNPNVTQTASLQWLDTLRGRAGYAAGRALWYVTAGAAIADMHAMADAPGAGLIVSDTIRTTAWTAGGGLEYALPFPHWSVKAEYLHLWFSKVNFPARNLAGGIVFNNLDIHLNENIVRVGLNYRFSTAGN